MAPAEEKYAVFKIDPSSHYFDKNDDYYRNLFLYIRTLRGFQFTFTTDNVLNKQDAFELKAEVLQVKAELDQAMCRAGSRDFAALLTELHLVKIERDEALRRVDEAQQRYNDFASRVYATLIGDRSTRKQTKDDEEELIEEDGTAHESMSEVETDCTSSRV